MTQAMQKELKVNAALVDMSNTAEESLAAYSSIKINAAGVLISEDVQKFIHKYSVKINAAAVLPVPAGCKMNMANGEIEISPNLIAKEPTVLIANGNITIHPDTQESIASFVKVIINGNVLAPNSMRGALANVTLNGKTTYYPDESTLVKGDLTIDNRFIRRAKQGESYYVTGKVMMTAPNLDMEQLIQKDVYFETHTAFLTESYGAAGDLMSGKARIRTVPNGYEVIEGNLSMDDTVSMRFGKKLYIMGGLSVPFEWSALYTQFEDIITCGTVALSEGVRSEWLKVISKFDSLWTYKGMLLEDAPSLEVNEALLGEYNQGVTIRACGSVNVDPSICVELLREKIHAVEACGTVSCGKEQLGLLQSRTKDCGNVSAIGETDEEEASEEEEGLVVKINTALYTL